MLPPADAAPRARAWKRWIERERTSTFVSLAGAAVTGFCTLHPATDDVRAGAAGAESTGQEAAGASAAAARGEIASFYVLPSEWRRGTGRRLGGRALAEARARGFAEVMVWVLETNARARGFYESLGFRSDGASKLFLERPYGSWRERRYRRAV